MFRCVEHNGSEQGGGRGATRNIIDIMGGRNIHAGCMSIFETASAVLVSAFMKQTTPTEGSEAVRMGWVEEPVGEMEERVVALLNAAVRERSCLMCGQNAEYHAEGCPIEGLEQWLNPFSEAV